MPPSIGSKQCGVAHCCGGAHCGVADCGTADCGTADCGTAQSSRRSSPHKKHEGKMSKDFKTGAALLAFLRSAGISDRQELGKHFVSIAR